MTVQPPQTELGSFSQVVLDLKSRRTQERCGVSAINESPEVRHVAGVALHEGLERPLPEAVKVVKSGLC